MSDIVIKVENLSKQYRLGTVGTGTLSHDLNRAWAKIRGKEDPYLKIGQANDRTKKAESDYVWALKDINFEVRKGEVLGIIGRNGAGKSTLLKILSQITRPTTGSVKMKGRVGSLLEVGTGFHPELTGRENIYINGAILGMRKHEIDKKLDEIIDFAGVERYIDTPVKRYSSGMMVRLGFSVAAHLEPEILIVDEVLAVGDVEFQKKCMGKMGDISKNDGRTILFVSHNMGAVEKLCSSGLVLKNGSMKHLVTDIKEAIQVYNLSEGFEAMDEAKLQQFKSPYLDFNSIYFGDHEGNCIRGPFSKTSEVFIYIETQILEPDPALQIGFSLMSLSGDVLFWSFHTDMDESRWIRLKEGKRTIRCRIPLEFLNSGSYLIDIVAAIYSQQWIFEPGVKSPRIGFEVKTTYMSPYWTKKRPGIFAPTIEWQNII